MAASPSYMQTQVGQPDISFQQLQQQLIPPPLPPAPPSSDASPQAPSDQSGDDDLSPPPPEKPLPMPPAPVSEQEASAAQADIKKQLQSESDMYAQIGGQLTNIEDRMAAADRAQIAGIEGAQPPQPPKIEANPLQRMVPLLTLAALGGKLTKMDASAMLGASAGTIKGYLEGNQQLFENSEKQYQDAYQRFKDRQAEQDKIYETLRGSYKDMVDGDLRALNMAHQMTGDQIAVDQNTLNLREHWQEQVTRLAEVNEQMKDREYQQRVNFHFKQRADERAQTEIPPDVQGLDALLNQYHIQLPGLGMGGAKFYVQRLRDMHIKNPGKSDEEIVQSMQKGAAQTGGISQLARSEASTVGRREAQIAPAIAALNEPNNGIYTRLEAASKKLDWSSNEVRNRVAIGWAQGVSADPDIQSYITVMQDARSDLANILSRGGTQTDMSRRQAAEALPIVADYPTLHAAIRQNKGVADALSKGNALVEDAIDNGKSISEAVQFATPSQGTVTQKEIAAYAKKHGISEEAARAWAIKNNYTVQ